MAASVRSSSIGNASSAGASWSIAWPAGMQVGDVVYVSIVMLNIFSGRTATWADADATLRNNDVMSGNTKTSLFRRVIDGTEGANIAGAFVGGTGNNWAGIAVCVQGADTTTPEDATTTATVGAASSTANVCPSITAVAADDLYLGMAAGNSNTGTYTWPGGTTEEQDGGSTGRISMASRALVASGATGTTTATASAAAAYTTYSILVRAAATNITPSAVPMTLVVQAPTITTDANPAPAAVPLTLLVQAPTITGSADVAPAAVPMTLTVEAPSILVGTSVDVPAAVPMVMTVQAPTITSDTAVSVPGAVPMTLLVLAPTVQGDTAVTGVGAVPLAFAFPAPTIRLDANPAPAAVPLTFLFPAPTVRGDTTVTVPAAVPMVLSVLLPTVLISVHQQIDLRWQIFGAVGRSLELDWQVFSEARYTSPLSDDDLLDLRFIGTRTSCFRWDLLDATGNVLGQVHPDLDASVPTISNDTSRAIKRDLKGFILAPEESASINAYTMRIRPVMVLQNGSEYPWGTFLFVEGSRSPHTYGRIFSGSLLDASWLVDQPTEQTTNFDYGYSIATAIQQVLAPLSGLPTIVIDGFNDTTGSPVTWPAGTSRLKIVNDLCALAGCYDLYFDRWGVGRVRVVPEDITQVAPSVTYVDGSCGTGKALGNILEGTTIETENLLDSPNRFVVIDNQAKDAPIVGSFDIPDSAPNSFYNRGFRIVQVINEQGLVGPNEAVARAKAAAAQAAADFSWWSFQGIIDPRHDTYDVLSVRGTLVREQKWSTSVQEGSPMSHDVRLAYA